MVTSMILCKEGDKVEKKYEKWLWILLPILAILTALIEYGEFIAGLIFLIFFLSNKKARNDFRKFWKEHKKQIILFLLLFLLPFIIVFLIPYFLQ
jgi:hypothetical protein